MDYADDLSLLVTAANRMADILAMYAAMIDLKIKAGKNISLIN